MNTVEPLNNAKPFANRLKPEAEMKRNCWGVGV